jgi:hypothetical protein
MTDGVTGIIMQLEQQRTAIDRALVALRQVEGIGAPTPATPASTGTPATPEGSGRKGKKRSAATRRRMAEAQRRRYAALRDGSEPPAPAAPEAPKPKRQISAAGMKRIIAATKKRWRLQRAAGKAALEMAEGKKAARKKAAVSAVTKKAAKKSAPVKKVAKKKSATAPAAATPTE